MRIDGRDLGEIKNISPMPKPLCTKALPEIMGEMRDFSACLSFHEAMPLRGYGKDKNIEDSFLIYANCCNFAVKNVISHKKMRQTE